MINLFINNQLILAAFFPLVNFRFPSKFSTIVWQAGNAVEFKFPDVFTVPEKVSSAQKIKLYITSDVSAGSPTWSDFAVTKYQYQRTADGFHRFRLPHFSHAHQDLSTPSITTFDPAAAIGAFKFEFLLQNLGPDYVNFDQAIVRILLPDINKIIKAGSIKWVAAAVASSGIMNYADDTGTTGTLTLFWGLASGAATGLTGNTDTRCPVNIMLTASSSQIYWNSLTFSFAIATTARSFSVRDYLTLSIIDDAVAALGQRFVLLNSIKHNLPVIENIINVNPSAAAQTYLTIAKIGSLPPNTYFVALKVYLYKTTAASGTISYTLEINEGLSISPIKVRKFTYATIPATAPSVKVDSRTADNAKTFRGLRAFTYPDNPTTCELKSDRPSAGLIAIPFKADMGSKMQKIEKKSFNIPHVRFPVDSPISATIDSFLIPISYDLAQTAGSLTLVRVVITFNPRVLLVAEPLKGVVLVGVIFATYAADAVTSYKGSDYNSDASTLASATTLRLNTIYIPADRTYASISLVCVPTSASTTECGSAAEYVPTKAIAGVALYKSKIVNYPTPYADTKVFDFIFCLSTATYAATPDTTTAFALVADEVLAFNSYVITGIGSGGVSQVAAPYFTGDSSTFYAANDFQKYYYLRLEGSFNTPVFSPSKAAFFSHDISALTLVNADLSQKLIDFQEGVLTKMQKNDGVVVTSTSGTSLYLLQVTAPLEEYENWLVEGSFSFEKKGMFNKVNVYQALSGSKLLSVASIKTLTLAIYDDKNVYAVYRILGSVIPNSQLIWTKESATINIHVATGVCGGTDQATSITAGILDYENLVTRTNLDIHIRTGLGLTCDVRSGNKGIKKGASFVIMTKYDVIDKTVPIVWDHAEQNQDNKCFYHELTITASPSFYHVICQADSYNNADFGNPNKYVHLKLKPLNPLIYLSTGPNILNYIWSNADGKRIYQLPDTTSVTYEGWTPTCSADIEVGWAKIDGLAATPLTLVPNSYPLAIKNKRRYVLAPITAPYIGLSGPETKKTRKLLISILFTAPHNVIKGCKHDFLTCAVVLPADIATTAIAIELGNYLDKEYVIDIEKLVVTLVFYGTTTKAVLQNTDTVSTDLTKFSISVKDDAGAQLQEKCTFKIKNRDLSGYTISKAVLARDLKLIQTFNSLGTFRVTITSTLPIFTDSKIALIFANGVLPSNLDFFKLACVAYGLNGKLDNRVYVDASIASAIIFKVNLDVDKISFVASCQKIPFSVLSTTNEISFTVKVLSSAGVDIYPADTPLKLPVAPEVIFKKSVTLKTVLAGVGFNTDYIFNFALNPGMTVTTSGRIVILFTHINPARLNNEGMPQCSLNRLPTTCIFLEDYLLSVAIPTTLLSLPAGSTLPPPLNELVIGGVKQGDYYDKPSSGSNYREFRQNDKIYFTVDTDSNHLNGVLVHDYLKDPIIAKAADRSSVVPSVFNVRLIQVDALDEKGRVAVKVSFLKKLVAGQSLAISLPRNLREANFTVSGLNIELNRETPLAENLFIKNVYFLKKGVLKIDLLEDTASNPIYATVANSGNAITYSSSDISTFPAYVLTISLDLNYYALAKKFVLSKDKFEFYIVDTISNIILESSSPEINFVEKKPDVQPLPTLPNEDYVKFKLSNTDTPADVYVQIVHKTTGKCLRRTSIEKLELIFCDYGNQAIANTNAATEFDSTLFQLDAIGALPSTGTAITIGNPHVHAVLKSKASGSSNKLGADTSTPPQPKFGTTPYNYFRITYSRDITNFNNIPVFTMCASVDVVVGGSTTYTWKTENALCLNAATTGSSNVITYIPLSTTGKAAQLFSFRTVKLKPANAGDILNVEQKIDFQADFVVIEWKITSGQATSLYFSVQGANTDVAVSNACNSRYPDRSIFQFVQSRNEYGTPIVRFRAPLLKLKSCGFLEISTTNANLIGKIGYYTDPYSPASGKFSLVTIKLDSVTSERVTRIDNPDSYNWYFRNTIAAVALNIGSELTFFENSKFEKMIYTLPSIAHCASLKLKAFEKYSISRLTVFLINLDNLGTGADTDAFTVPITPTATSFLPNVYNFTLTLKNVVSGRYKMILRYVVRPATATKRILTEENVALRRETIDKRELEKYSFVNVEIQGSEENGSLVLRFVGFLVVLVMIAMN